MHENATSTNVPPCLAVTQLPNWDRLGSGLVINCGFYYTTINITSAPSVSLIAFLVIRQIGSNFRRELPIRR